MRKYTQEEKQNAIARYAINKEPVSIILSESGIPKSTFYGWLEEEREATRCDASNFTAANFHSLRSHTRHLELVVAFLKESNCSPNAPLREKLSETLARQIPAPR